MKISLAVKQSWRISASVSGTNLPGLPPLTSRSLSIIPSSTASSYEVSYTKVIQDKTRETEPNEYTTVLSHQKRFSWDRKNHFTNCRGNPPVHHVQQITHHFIVFYQYQSITTLICNAPTIRAVVFAG